MKKILCLILSIFLLGGLSACGVTETGREEIPKPEKEAAYRTVRSEEQCFETACDASYTSRWDSEDGLYIYTDMEGSIPYVLIYRYADMPIEAGQFLEESIMVHMQELYGDDMKEIGAMQEYDVGGEKLPGILFTYEVEGYTVHSLRLCKQIDGDIVNFTAKYLDGEGDSTMEALSVAVEHFALSDEAKIPQTEGKQEPEAITVKQSESAAVQYVSYSDPAGNFTAEIPEGWTVQTGLKPTGEFDYISFAVTVFDTQNPDRMLYLNLACSGMLKSQAAKDWQIRYYGENGPFSQQPVIEPENTEGFFSNMGGIYDYSDFTILENMGTTALGGDLLRGSFLSSETGNRRDGLFTAFITSYDYPVQVDMFNPAAGMVDCGLISAYTVVMETAREGELLDWQPVLDHCLSTLQFTDSFRSARQQEWNQTMQTSQYLSQQANEISDSIMSSWENQNRSYDIMSQKQSDATLGYERVQDTETGEYLRARNGFFDRYDGSRYQLTDADDAYLSPIAGYIEW